MNEKVCKVIKTLQKIIEKSNFFEKIIKLSKEFLKFELLRDSNKIKVTANHMKNTKYIKCMKWISET